MFLGFFAWYAGMARAGIAKASQMQLAQPALAMVWGWPLLGEDLSVPQSRRLPSCSARSS